MSYSLNLLKNIQLKTLSQGIFRRLSLFPLPVYSESYNSSLLKHVKILGDIRGYSFGFIAVSSATLFAILIDKWVPNVNLVLIYVFSVIITGLRYGSRPALAASIISFFSINYFLIVPKYTFEVELQEEWETLIFFFLIAVTCGPAASHVRKQFILLTEANRYSEAMRDLGGSLSVAENIADVWLATANNLSTSLQNHCYIVTLNDNDGIRSFPHGNFQLAELKCINWSYKTLSPSGRLTDNSIASNWTFFPIVKDQQCIACAAFEFSKELVVISQFNQNLISSMLHQAANTWRRIQLVSELETTRLSSEVEQLRSALLSSVSHDLKSPLSAMMGAAESLRVLDKQLNELDRIELIDTIVQESRRLDSYIQNLLDMTHLGHGELNIECDWVSGADIVGSALGRLRRFHPKVSVETFIQGEPPYLYVNSALLEQALFNILENAVKFSPSDEKITVNIQKMADKCIFAIDDKGPGIPLSLREKIFDMFYVVSDGDKKQKGTGMGLAICKGMVEAHGGVVFAKQGTNNQGTCIVVELPIKPFPGNKKMIEED